MGSRAIKADPCAGWEMIRPSVKDTPETLRQVAKHDCHGIAAKCWVAPSKAAADMCKGLKP